VQFVLSLTNLDHNSLYTFIFYVYHSQHCTPHTTFSSSDSLCSFFMFAPCINTIKKLLLFQLMHTIIKNHRMLKQFESYNTCSDMFRFTQEPSSRSSPVLS